MSDRFFIELKATYTKIAFMQPCPNNIQMTLPTSTSKGLYYICSPF